MIGSLEGRWEGRTSRGAAFTWIIGNDGSYESIYQSGLVGSTTKRSGTIRIEGGQIRWRSVDGQRGTLTVHEEGGQRVLRGTVEGQKLTFDVKLVALPGTRVK